MPISATDLNKAYLAYFGRPVDFTGKTHFANLELADVIKAFDSSAESQALYGSDVAAKVNAIYNNLFNRDAEPAGLLHWSTLIGQGRITAAEAAFKIMEGALGSDVTAVQNKLSASEAFAAELNTTAELLGYSGMAAAAAARAFLKTVDATPESLTAAVAAVGATVATVVASGGPAGQIFTLTTGLDTINGTAGNDTINAHTAAAGFESQASTLNAADVIDGGAGTDTLNIHTADSVGFGGGLGNSVQQGTVKNVEIININNTNIAVFGNNNGVVDASKFEDATQIWQKSVAVNVVNLAATTTAGFRGELIGSALNVQAAAAATSATVAFDGVDESATLTVGVDLAATDAKLSTVNVGGTRKDGIADANATVTPLNLTVAVGKDVQSLTLNTTSDVTLTASPNGKAINTVDASGSTGSVTYISAAPTVSTIKTGAGKDTVIITTTTVKDDAATVADETVTATVTTGAGNDKVTVRTTGTGVTTVSTGDGDDMVHVTARGTTLKVDMGAGDDSFTSDVAITSKDTIDAGEGSDTLLLSLVGAANVVAFKNFDVFDVAGMGANLDLNLLTAKNTVTEIVGSAALTSNTTLENVTTGFRATGDMGIKSTLTLDQKTAGALTVTLDADEAGQADDGAELASMRLVAVDATSVSAVFDTAYLADTAAEKAFAVKDDNFSTIVLTTKAATAVSVTSGGANATNNLVLTDDAGTAAKLAAVTITGAQALSLSFASTLPTALASIDASGSTGGLTASLAALKNGGTLTLGSGADVITVTNASTGAGIENIIGFEKTAAVAVSVAAGDALATAAAIADADVLVLAGATAANASGGVTTATIAKGVLTFTGAGPATLTDAVAIANAFAETAGEAALFEYDGSSYVFVQDGITDTVVKLVGITGVTNFVENGGTDQFFIV